MAVAGGAGVAVHQRIDCVDEIKIAVEQKPTDQHTLRPDCRDWRGAVHDHAAILGLAAGGLRGNSRNKRDARAIGKGYAGLGQREQIAGRENVDLGGGLAA